MDNAAGSGEEIEEVGLEEIVDGTDPFYKFPHIDSLYKNADILDEPEVIVTEKLDGTSFRVGFAAEKFKVVFYKTYLGMGMR